MVKLVPALAVLLMATPVFAQGSTQSPPSPNAGSSGPAVVNSVPPTASNTHSDETRNPNLAGSALSTTNTTTGRPTASANAPHVDGPADGFAHTVPSPAR